MKTQPRRLSVEMSVVEVRPRTDKIRGVSIKFLDCVRCVSYDVFRENPITSSCYAICAEYMSEILTLYCYSVIFDAVLK